MKTIYTIGHSTRTIEQFLGLLDAHHIQHVVDVRMYPYSRRHPQFSNEPLAANLQISNIAYSHMRTLGGRRRPVKDSPNTGWENESFRGYADYMATSEFASALYELETLAARERVAIMCSEAVPWRCHRSLIADALTVRGWQVLHITSKKTAKQHALTPFLHVCADGKLLYPAQTQ